MSSLNSSAAASSQTDSAMDTSEEQPMNASVDAGPVQAYAKLEGEDFCYYIRTLQVTLGRKAAKPDNVDIPLGNTKSVSRQHARLFYNFTTQRFEMMVFGKNGAFVNEQFVERGVTVPLENRTKIQIGEVSFVFLLPRMDMEESPRDEGSGYISTPRQLEKQTLSSRREDYRDHEDSFGSDDRNETPEPNPYAGKDIKPPYSYASLIAQAINSTSDKRMTLNGIYTYITTHYPYYQMAQNGWQNSIRHNLSLNKAFLKVPRGDAEPGKGAFWTIDTKAENQFANGVYRKNKRPVSKGGTGSSSPVSSEIRKRFKKEGSDSDDESIIVDHHTESPSSTAETSPAHTEPKQPKVTAAPEQEPTPAPPPPTPPTSTATTTAAPPAPSQPPNANSQNIQAQLQLQLQNTIRQHLLDPVKFPLPASIAQLLPQAIAQLPPQLASQLSATLQSALRAHDTGNNNKEKSGFNAGPLQAPSSQASTQPWPSLMVESSTSTPPPPPSTASPATAPKE